MNMAPGGPWPVSVQAFLGRQRLYIGLARTRHGEPSLLMPVEPDTNLDDVGVDALNRAVVRTKAKGCPIADSRE